jgi:hypothetical protein
VKKNKQILVFLLLITLLSWFSYLPAKAIGECGGIYSPYEMLPANCQGTIVVDDGWLFTRSNKQWDFYKLEFEDRVTVDYIENNMYFVKWYFSGSRDPIVGWIEFNKVLLDRDVVR